MRLTTRLERRFRNAFLRRWTRFTTHMMNIIHAATFEKVLGRRKYKLEDRTIKAKRLWCALMFIRPYLVIYSSAYAAIRCLARSWSSFHRHIKVELCFFVIATRVNFRLRKGACVAKNKPSIGHCTRRSSAISSMKLHWSHRVIASR